MSRLLAGVDGRIGRVPMLRLVAVGLAALAVVALVLALAGVLRYPFPTLLATLVVALLVSVVGDRVMAALARARPVGESAIVTGLILFFRLRLNAA